MARNPRPAIGPMAHALISESAARRNPLVKCEYRVLHSNDAAELETSVIEMLNKGWRCVGGVCFSMLQIKTDAAGMKAFRLLYAQAIERVTKARVTK